MKIADYKEILEKQLRLLSEESGRCDNSVSLVSLSQQIISVGNTMLAYSLFDDSPQLDTDL